jgi:hypothetical protein
VADNVEGAFESVEETAVGGFVDELQWLSVRLSRRGLVSTVVEGDVLPRGGPRGGSLVGRAGIVAGYETVEKEGRRA